MGGLGCLCFGNMLGGLWASPVLALWGLSQGTDFVLFSCLLLWMLPTFQGMLFYSLINGLPVVQVIVVVHVSVDLAVDATAHLWVYCWVSFLVLLWWFE